MNKPAPKEPSMDEILSSIRQIIADDDAAAAPRKPPVPTTAAPSPTPVPRVAPAPVPQSTEPADGEPLALTRDQVVRDKPAEPAAPISFSDILGEDAAGLAGDEAAADAGPQLVDPEDVTFEGDETAKPSEMAAFSVPMDEPAPRPEPPRPAPAPQQAPPPPPRASAAGAAPMPDPTLSADLAERLLEPTTDAVVKNTFAKLGNLSMAGSGQTIDALLRDMLRPMLKEWLDENLPTIVERMVEKEISRISRGGE